MNLQYIWFKNSRQHYKSLILIMVFMLIFVITLSLVAEYNSEIIIDDSELGESSDIIVSASSESKNYYQDAYQNDIFAEIINIVESNSKSKIKQIKQVETLSGIMQEQRRNNSLEAVIDQRELLSKVFVVDEIVWSSINFVNKSDKSLIYSKKNDNIRMINDTIFLNIADNFQFNFSRIFI